MRRLGLGDLDDMLREAGVSSSIHRRRIAEAVAESADDFGNNDEVASVASSSCVNGNGNVNDDNGSIDVYISFDKTRSAELASLIRMQLELRGLVVRTADNTRHNACALDYVREASSFVIVLASGALDGCLVSDNSSSSNGSSAVRSEIAAALESGCNVVPVIDDFQFPQPEELREDVRALCYFNAVRWVHDYQGACVDKLERFVRKVSDLGMVRSESVGRLSTASGRSTPNGGHIKGLMQQHNNTPVFSRRRRSNGAPAASAGSAAVANGRRSRTVSVESGFSSSL